MSFMLISISFALYCGILLSPTCWLLLNGRVGLGHERLSCKRVHQCVLAETLTSKALQEAKNSMQVWPKLSEVERMHGVSRKWALPGGR